MPTKTFFVLRVAFQIASVAGLFGVSGCAHNDAAAPLAQRGPIGYVTDANGNVVHSGAGQCVRTGFWQPQYAIKECDPELVAEMKPPEPKPAEVATAPAPEVKPEASAPQPVRVYVGADAYFDFDRDQLTPRDARTLNDVTERLRKENDVSVRIVGYTDQIGSDDYNLSLSERRADAVKTYLIAHGIAENTISVEARGETDPIVRCEGRQGATLIDCLQPNRRAEIEFSALEPVEER
jgi:OmpA-OmpF porin, OOP family